MIIIVNGDRRNVQSKRSNKGVLEVLGVTLSHFVKLDTCRELNLPCSDC